MPGRTACKHKSLPIGHPGSAHMIDRIGGEPSWLSRSRWQQHELGRNAGRVCDSPFPVGREGNRKSSAQADGGRSVRPADINFVVRAGCVSAFGEQDGLPVAGDVLYL